MLQPWLLLFCSLLYIGALFGIAWYGDRQTRLGRPVRHRALIYSLSLGVYCTSWTYYGAVGRATTAGWEFFSIYLGPILVFVLGYKFLKKVAAICREQNITTIADFISSRYGKSGSLAVLVTVVATLGTMPYIALQLKAVALSYQVLTFDGTVTDVTQFVPRSLIEDTGFIVAALMALFSILFGARYVNASEHHEGIILAIAFESVVKLVALVCVCLFAVYGVFGGMEELLSTARQSSEINNLLLNPSISENFLKASFLIQTLLAMAAIFCLPRQFHVTFVENTDASQLRMAWWLFPAYLLVISLLVVPITLAGSIVFQGLSVNPDMFVLTLPITFDSGFLAMLAFIGGFSAATSMVIVAVIALSTMVCNDIVMPLLFKLPRLNLKARKDLTGLLLLVRRVAIVAIMFMSYVYYQYIRDIGTLASIGLIAFVAAMQFAPAIIGGVYWKQGHRRGARMGLIAGAAVWFYTLFLPTLADTGWLPADFVTQGLFQIEMLKPYALFGFDGLDPITHGAIWSLLVNVLFYVYFSLEAHANLTDRVQAVEFTHSFEDEGESPERESPTSDVELRELMLLAEKFIGERSSERAFADYEYRRNIRLSSMHFADDDLIRFTEHLLAGAIGASSARVMVDSVTQHRHVPIEEIVSIVGEASQAVQFNQELLNSTIENIDQGISVVDSEMRLVAWNQRYLDIFEYPPDFIRVNQPVADVIRFNAEKGECGPGDVQTHIDKRLHFMRAGNPHIFQRVRSNGTVLEIRGNPMPGGGFVTSFSDITEHKNIELKLREANDNLERRVRERTEELENVNQELHRAIDSKMRFLAAVNHDMMQPLNAARLYTSALMQTGGDAEAIPQRINNSLQSAEDIVKTLLDISKLDSGGTKVDIHVFAVSEVLSTLAEEFSVIAQEREIELNVIECSANTRSDPHLLRRILQNFLSNAMRYAKGRVTLGCRRVGVKSENPCLKIEVWDNGVGIAAADLDRIFDEFERLDNQPANQEKGVGLGLAIAKRISSLLGHKIDVHCRAGRGTVFSLTVPLSRQALPLDTSQLASIRTIRPQAGSISGMTVLCIDNDADVLEAMRTILQTWECDVISAVSYDDALQCFDDRNVVPDVMLVDYHLHTDQNGIDVMNAMRDFFGRDIPGVLITADRSEKIKEAANDAGFRDLRKPLNPTALKNVLLRFYQWRQLSGSEAAPNQ
ncbi:MAG: PAS domain-containing hybrid sensor histidine kinase/response regulator [Pseudomonadota bacterium]